MHELQQRVVFIKIPYCLREADGRFNTFKEILIIHEILYRKTIKKDEKTKVYTRFIMPHQNIDIRETMLTFTKEISLSVHDFALHTFKGVMPTWLIQAVNKFWQGFREQFV